jgi:hypothetical protein
MPVVIEDLDVQVQPPPPQGAPAQAGNEGGGEPDPKAITALLQREAWRQQRLSAD